MKLQLPRSYRYHNADAICFESFSGTIPAKPLRPSPTNPGASLYNSCDTSGIMSAPDAQVMRLTVEVLPLEEENAHGPYRDHALAVFKGRKFALPVRWSDTFEQVWNQIEQRYKKNYLDPQQAA
jgi:hypothetical protein